MEYKINSKEELLSEIANLAQSLGRTPKRRDMQTYQITACKRLFGSFSAALSFCGFKCKKNNLSKEEAINELMTFHRKKGFIPANTSKFNELRDRDTYLKVLECNNWKELHDKLGIEYKFSVHKNFPESIEELVYIAKTIIKKDNIKSFTELQSHKEFWKRKTLAEHNIDLKDFALKVGIPITRYDITFSEVKKAIIRYYNKTGKVPAVTDLDYGEHLLKKKFGTYSDLLKRCHLKPRTKSGRTKTREQMLALYIRKSKRNGYKFGIPSTCLFKETGITHNIWMNMFHSMKELRKDAGFPPFREHRLKWDKEAIFKIVESETNRLGKLTKEDFRANPRLPSATTVYRNTGLMLNRYLSEFYGEGKENLKSNKNNT